MRIITSNHKNIQTHRSSRQAPQSESQKPSESVTLYESSSGEKLLSAATSGVMAAVPVFGALMHSKWYHEGHGVSALGVTANLAGTLAWVAGAGMGNQTALNVSYGLLGGSGLLGACTMLSLEFS